MSNNHTTPATAGLPPQIIPLLPPKNSQAFQAYQVALFGQLEGKVYQSVESEIENDEPFKEFSDYEKAEHFQNFLKYWEHNRSLCMQIHLFTLFEQCALRARLADFALREHYRAEGLAKRQEKMDSFFGFTILTIVVYAVIMLVNFVVDSL